MLVEIVGLGIIPGEDPVNIQVANAINERIRKINLLIKRYNKAGNEKDAVELLLEIHQAHQQLDATVKGLSITNLDLSLEYIEKVHALFVDQLKNEFLNCGVKFNEKAINFVDFSLLASREALPNSFEFAKLTRVNFLNRLMGGDKHSVAIKTAIRLLSSLDLAKIKESTKENYENLTLLKRALRDVLYEFDQMTEADQNHIRHLIQMINGAISNILTQNESLAKELMETRLEIAESIAQADNANLIQIISYLVKPEPFNQDDFKIQFRDKFPGLDQFQIRFLGGNNSRNYLLQDPVAGTEFVLKITPELGNTFKAAEYLEHTSVSESLADVYCSRRRILCNNQFHGIEITEFCSQGDVLSYGRGIVDDEERMASAWLVYDQMAEVLIHLTENNILFPDMKPTNFLVAEHNRLVIADTKSFIEIPSGTFKQAEVNKTQEYLFSEGFQPPELAVRPFTSDIDKHHSYLLGMSLFIYLSGLSADDATQNAKDNGGMLNHAFFAFDKYPIFQTERGAMYKQLIQQMIEKDPKDRINLIQVKERLELIQHGMKVENSSFKSKTEAYFYTIDYLMQLQKKYNNPLIAFAISQMKILVENHEQNPLIAAEIIANLSDEPEVEDLILAEEGFMLDDIALAIKTSAYEQTLLEKYENPLARQFESQMQIAILHSPTAAMMSSVRAISNAILYVFAQMEEQGKKGVLEKFVKDLTSGKNPTGFGSQPQEITLDTVKQILEANRPEDLNQILFIHFLFAQKEMRAVPETIHAPNKRMPTGRLLEIIKKYNNGEYRDHPQAFFDEMNFDKLRLVSDVEIYNSHLFTAEPDRGRDGKLADKFSSRMGLLLEHQHQGDLPADRSHWTPDAQYQKANLDSIYVRDLIENDAVYASGPSGMTSLFLGIMEMYGNFSTVQEKQNYFAAVSAYMVSGGLHSLHEVLGPAQYGLGLIPGYRVTAPDHGVIAAPPNFHQFYQQQMELDPDFATRYDAGWEKLMTVYAQERHLHIHKPIERFNPDSMVQLVAAHQIETASVAVINSKNAADRMINVLDKALKHYSIDFADTSEGDEAIRVLDQIKKEDKLSSVMNHFKAYFDALVEAKGSKAKNNTFIGFLFNQLKKDEQLISFINNHNQPKSVLKLDPNLDYIAPNLSDKREEALQAFRAMNICEPQMDPPTEQRVSSIRDKLQALRSQHLDPEVPKFDAGVT